MQILNTYFGGKIPMYVGDLDLYDPAKLHTPAAAANAVSGALANGDENDRAAANSARTQSQPAQERSGEPVQWEPAVESWHIDKMAVASASKAVKATKTLDALRKFICQFHKKVVRSDFAMLRMHCCT